jgi:preprotein translocase subunit SecD
MAEPAGSTGCFSQLMLLIAAIVMPFFAAFQSSNSLPIATVTTQVLLSPITDTFTPAQLEQAAATIERRLAALQIEAATVAVVDGKEIVVGLPALDDMNAIIATFRVRGLLEFVDFSGVDTGGSSWDGKTIATSGGNNEVGLDAAVSPLTNLPFVTVLTGSQVVRAEAQESQFGSWQVQVEFSAAGAETLKTFTSTHVGQPMAIVVDGVVISVPIIQTEISTPVILSGNFTQEQARQLAVQIGSGALPFEMQVDSVEAVEGGG